MKLIEKQTGFVRPKNQALIDYINDKRSKRFTWQQIADEMGISLVTLYRYRRETGMPREKARRFKKLDEFNGTTDNGGQ
jgi:hypothetical protein